MIKKHKLVILILVLSIIITASFLSYNKKSQENTVFETYVHRYQSIKTKFEDFSLYVKNNITNDTVTGAEDTRLLINKTIELESEIAQLTSNLPTPINEKTRHVWHLAQSELFNMPYAIHKSLIQISTSEELNITHINRLLSLIDELAMSLSIDNVNKDSIDSIINNEKTIKKIHIELEKL